jgi:hypothetical protein
MLVLCAGKVRQRKQAVAARADVHANGSVIQQLCACSRACLVVWLCLCAIRHAYCCTACCSTVLCLYNEIVGMLSCPTAGTAKCMGTFNNNTADGAQIKVSSPRNVLNRLNLHVGLVTPWARRLN